MVNPQHTRLIVCSNVCKEREAFDVVSFVRMILDCATATAEIPSPRPQATLFKNNYAFLSSGCGCPAIWLHDSSTVGYLSAYVVCPVAIVYIEETMGRPQTPIICRSAYYVIANHRHKAHVPTGQTPFVGSQTRAYVILTVMASGRHIFGEQWRL